MVRFEFNTHDDEDYEAEFGGQEVVLKWDKEEENIYEILEWFKYFLLAKSYPPELVDRVQYLTDDQYAKMKLVD